MLPKLHGCLYRSLAGHVGLDEQCTAAELLDFALDLRAGFLVDLGNHHGRAFARECPRNAAANAAAGTRDETHSLLKQCHADASCLLNTICDIVHFKNKGVSILQVAIEASLLFLHCFRGFLHVQAPHRHP
jgi:hypothetical protein